MNLVIANLLMTRKEEVTFITAGGSTNHLRGDASEIEEVMIRSRMTIYGRIILDSTPSAGHDPFTQGRARSVCGRRVGLTPAAAAREVAHAKHAALKVPSRRRRPGWLAGSSC